MACLLESAGSTYCGFGRLTFPARSCHKRRMTNQSEFPIALSADQFEAMFPDDEACAEDLFRRRWPDGFVCPDCGSRNAVRLKRPRCVHQCRDCRKQTSVTAGTFMHRSHVPLRSWHRAICIMTSHSNGMSALQLQSHLGLGSYKSAWMLVHKIRRAMEVADGFPLIMNVQADETSIPYRLKGSEPPPGGRSHEGRLMIAGAVEVFGENSPGCAELRRIADQSGPTLKAFLEDSTAPGTWIAADGWAGCDGLENHAAIAVGDRPAHEVLEWIHRVFSNLKRWGLGVLHGFRRKHLDWQLVEWSFRWNWRQRRGESLFALLDAGLASGPATWKDITAAEA